MPIRYYPQNRIITNLYTRGQFSTPDGKVYTGRYYKTYDGQAFTGATPILGKNQPLRPIVQGDPQHAGGREYGGGVYGSLRDIGRTITLNEEGEDIRGVLTELKPFYPRPTEDDYARGYFTRYFAKEVTGPRTIFEISQPDWTKIQNGDIDPESLGYETAEILWQLTGPLNNKRISQYQIQGGVYDTNKRVTEGEARTFLGLVEYIGGDYTKFARITS
jgi:hypothetical protein